MLRAREEDYQKVELNEYESLICPVCGCGSMHFSLEAFERPEDGQRHGEPPVMSREFGGNVNIQAVTIPMKCLECNYRDGDREGDLEEVPWPKIYLSVQEWEGQTGVYWMVIKETK